jgi:hypothetical protein
MQDHAVTLVDLDATSAQERHLFSLEASGGIHESRRA